MGIEELSYLEHLGMWLAQDAQLQAVIEDRIYIEQPPQGAEMPYLLLNELTGSPVADLQGDTGTAEKTVEIDAWADGENGKVLSTRAGNRVKTLLTGHAPTGAAAYRGYLVTGGTFLDAAVCLRDQQLGMRPADGGDNYRYKQSQDYQLTIQ